MAAEKKSGSVLAMMAASITDRKAAAATGLTPVAGEGRPLPPPRVPDVPGTFLTNEALHDVAKDLRRQARVLALQAGVLIDVANGLDVTTGQSSTAEIDPAPQAAAEKKAEERAADAKAALTPETEAIVARIAALSDDAKAEVHEQAVYTPEQSAAALTAAAEAAAAGGDVKDVMAAAMAAVGWTCPEHGEATDKTSPKGRAYRGCPAEGCRNFELPS